MCLMSPVPSEPVPAPDAHLFLSNNSWALSQGQHQTLGLIQLQASCTCPVTHHSDDLCRCTMSSLGSHHAMASEFWVRTAHARLLGATSLLHPSCVDLPTPFATGGWFSARHSSESMHPLFSLLPCNIKRPLAVPQ